MLLKNLMLGAIVAMMLSLIGCDSNDGPAEKAGASVDNAIDEAGDKIEDAGDKIEDKMNR